jgi:hypothetical protein
MKKAGRALVPVIFAVAVVVVGLLFLVLASSGTSTAVADDFLVALAKGDAKTLADLGYMEGTTPDQAQKMWEKTLARAKYYRFAWRVKNTVQASPTNASVQMDVVRNVDTPGSFPDAYELPMVKIDGKWKVDVRGISRQMYPALPR